MTELVGTARGRFAVDAAGPSGGRPVTFWETPETWGAAVTEWLGVQAFG